MLFSKVEQKFRHSRRKWQKDEGKMGQKVERWKKNAGFLFSTCSSLVRGSIIEVAGILCLKGLLPRCVFLQNTLLKLFEVFAKWKRKPSEPLIDFKSASLNPSNPKKTQLNQFGKFICCESNWKMAGGFSKFLQSNPTVLRFYGDIV